MMNMTTRRPEPEPSSALDSEEDLELQEFAETVKFQIQEKTNQALQRLNAFLNNAQFINKKADPNTNIINRFRGTCYRIPEESIPRFFRRLESCRRTGAKLMFAELQDREESGLMLDFDILQPVPESQLSEGVLETLVSGVFGVLRKYLDLEPHLGSKRELALQCLVLRKPHVIPKEGHFKDGLHLLIPSILLNRKTKRWIIERIQAMGVLEDAFVGMQICGEPRETLDRNSAHVPVFFVGCSSKPEHPPYLIHSEYTCRIRLNLGTTTLQRSTLFQEATFNVALEYSLSFKGRVLPKFACSALDAYREEVVPRSAALYGNGGVAGDEADGLAEPLAAIALSDPNVQYVKNLLDILSPERARSYYDWFRVLCVLSNIHSAYKPLAEYFSRKAPEKFSPESFESHWLKACHSEHKGLHLGTLIWMAKEDNYEKWEVVRATNLHNFIRSRIYNPFIEGNLGHFDIAELLYKCLSDKFVFESRGSRSLWYEFILQSDPHRQGEVYKYRVWEIVPDTLLFYISRTLIRIFEEILPNLISIEKSTTDEELKKYHIYVRNNFKVSARNLMNSNFKSGVCVAARQLFRRPGFGEMLDKDPQILGVGNGVLRLGREISFVARQHDYLISKFTPINYQEFNPYNAKTKEVLIALRTLFPDNEVDTHHFMMHYLASTLDNRIKDSLFLMIIGGGSNGKSFLMELHKATIGETYSVKLPLEFFTKEARNSESAMPCMMQLQHARLAYLSESDKATKLVLRKIKELTGAESVYARQLHESGINFKPHCHYIALSNNDFIVEGSDYGTWRRILRLQMKNQFFGPNDKNYNPENPRHKLANRNLGKRWPEDPEICAAYLSVLTWYYQSYLENYEGSLTNITCDTLRRETEEYQNTQDRMNLFINSRAVRCASQDEKYMLLDSIALYQKWYEQQFGLKITSDTAQTEFINSRLGKFIKQTREGCVLEGHRILDTREAPDEGERYFVEMFEEDEPRSPRTQAPSETPEQYYARICREWSEKKETLRRRVRNGGALDRDDAADKSDAASPVDADLKEDDEAGCPLLANAAPVLPKPAPESFRVNPEELDPIEISTEMARLSLQEKQSCQDGADLQTLRVPGGEAHPAAAPKKKTHLTPPSYPQSSETDDLTDSDDSGSLTDD